ncbi:MAG: hypothetical protein KGP12_02900 [Actinomycetales bacterium]|nr:hypothetical protein [Actinomycetales bacterium]
MRTADALLGVTVLAGCSSSSESTDTAASADAGAAEMLPPVIITEDQTSATCKVGNFLDVIVAEDKLAGATLDSSDTAIVEVTQAKQAKQDGDALFNPGGSCLAPGDVTLTLTGPDGATRDIALTVTE